MYVLLSFGNNTVLDCEILAKFYVPFLITSEKQTFNLLYYKLGKPGFFYMEHSINTQYD